MLKELRATEAKALLTKDEYCFTCAERPHHPGNEKPGNGESGRQSDKRGDVR